MFVGSRRYQTTPSCGHGLTASLRGLENSAGRSGAGEVVEASGGLPEVIVQWARNARENYDLERLRQIKLEVQSRKYTALKLEFENADKREREVLLLLAFLRHATPTSTLAEMSRQHPETCNQILRKWERRKRVSSRTPYGQMLPVYDFDENTRDVARRNLPGTFSDGGAELETRALSAFLSHFSLERFEFPSPKNPCSPLYLCDAIELIAASAFLEREKEQIPPLFVLLRISIDGRSPAYSVL